MTNLSTITIETQNEQFFTITDQVKAEAAKLAVKRNSPYFSPSHILWAHNPRIFDPSAKNDMENFLKHLAQETSPSLLIQLKARRLSFLQAMVIIILTNHC